MNIYTFIINKETQKFTSIILQDSNSISFIGVNLEVYSALTTDEATARQNFTLTGHLPSEKFESLMLEAKEL
jgi:hypothetical protein